MEVDNLSTSPAHASNLFAHSPAQGSSTNPLPLPPAQSLPTSISGTFESESRLDQLDEEGVAALFASLGFPYYDEQLREHGITGEILIHLDHEALRDVGIHSVGQRLAILRAVYERKVAQNVPVEEGGWRPPEEIDFEGAEGAPSAQLLSLLSERDNRILGLEYEVHKLQESLLVLRDDTLRLSQGSPALKSRQGTMRSPTSSGFPHPLSNASTLPIPSNLSRSRSPSHPAPPPSLALPNSLAQSSSAIQLSGGAVPDSPRSPLDSPRAFNTPQTNAASGEAMLGDSMFTSAGPGAVAPTTPTHASELLPTPGLLSASGSSSRPPNSREKSGDGKDGSSGGDANNPYRSFRVTLEDPCYKVLPAALKKYKINDDWRQYALFICHGNTERCLAYDEKPLLLFQRLKEGNANPVFMLRHIKDIKSPIAVASAKHAVRRDKRAVNAGQGLDRLPTVGRDGAPLTMVGGSGVARPTRLHHPPVLLPVGGKDVDDAPPPSPRSQDQPGNCIAIYPYLADREDEFDVEVGDTFSILAKTKGWWVVHRDLPNGTAPPSDRKSAWVPAGCLLETSVPPLSLPGAGEYVPASSSNAATLPIEPQYVVSVSTPGLALMDYDKNGSDELEVRKGQALRILKRYNHWSYAIKEDGQRGWIPSWFCSRSSSSSSAAAAAAAAGASRGDATPTTPTAMQPGANSLTRSATRQGSVPALRTGGTAGEGEDLTEGAAGGIVLGGM